MLRTALIVTVLLALHAPAGGQQTQQGFGTGAGSTSCPLPRGSSCNHTLTYQPTLNYADNANQIDFKPSRPGTYAFKFEATDLCKSTSVSTSVVAQCPPNPIPRLSVSSSQIYQGNSAILNSAGTVAGYAGGELKRYEWRVTKAPENSPLFQHIATQFVISNSTSTYTTPPLAVAGSYQMMLSVFDGCSTSSAVVCFEVQCNCGPTANAGATTTIWTNTGAGSNEGRTNKGDNIVGINDGSGTSFVLDGSLSYDFDKSELLSYQWDFKEWKSLTPALTWDRTTDTQPGRGQAGVRYKTVCLEPVANQGRIQKECFFNQVPNSGSAGSVEAIPEAGLPGRTSTRMGAPTSSQAIVPMYIPNEEQFLQPTTSCMANVTRSESVQYTVTPYSQTIKTVPATAITDQTICQIRINQVSTSGVNSLPANNPRAYLTLSSLSRCRGLWSFVLTVTDKCGAATQDTDEIKVNVRCNEPPVAVAACNNTQEWTGSAFEQVRLDGRSSSDRDNYGARSLTYTWTFISQPAGHCPQNHVACVEEFCNNPNYFTEGDYSTGLVWRASAGATSTCAPTVYPIIRDKTKPTTLGCTPPNQCQPGIQCQQCQYEPVSPTQFHVGNSAYFTPKKSGTYHVRLQVDDGCSSDTSDVFVFAKCPTLTATVTIDNPTSTIQPQQGGGIGASSVKLTSSILYPVSMMSSLTYQWDYTTTASNKINALTWSGGSASKDTTASTSREGTYVITLIISDNCQEIRSTPVTWRVTCNTRPTQPTLNVVGGSNQVYFNGISFPRITIEAASQDSDALTYDWSINNLSPEKINNLQVDYGTSGVTKNQLSFTPPADSAVSTQLTYTVIVTAFDGCSVSPAGQISITLNCNGTLTARAGSDQSSSYDYAQSSFPESSFAGSTSIWPYSNVPQAKKIWQWTANYFDSPSAATGSIVTIGIQGATTDAFRIRPTSVGTYQVRLVINDGCREASTTVNLRTSCSVTAVAIVTPASMDVEFNSYLGTAGGFASVTLDGSASNGNAGSPLTYNWQPQSQLVAGQGGVTLNTPVVTFTPQKSGTTQFTLQVNNGPCPLSSPAAVIVNAVCPIITAQLKEPGSIQAGSSLYSRAVSWDGTRFPTVCLDGTSTSYTTIAGAAAKFPILRYQWQMQAAPLSSRFEATLDPTTVSVPSQRNMTQGVNGFVEVLINSTAEVEFKTRTWENYTTLRTTTVQTFLNNHHDMRPYTCFKPDLAGTYRVQLTVTDGCSSSAATATITVSCNPSPVVSVTSVGAEQIEGNRFKRIPLTGAVSNIGSTETLSYQWTLTSAPTDSDLFASVGSAVKINNNQAPTASFVPDKAGTYTFSFIVEDGCNPRVTVQHSVVTTCLSVMSLTDPVASPTAIQWVGSAATMNGVWTPSSADFAERTFTLTGGVEGTCNVLHTKWYFVERTCGTTYVPSAAPPTPAPVAQGCASQTTCDWKLCSEPCTSTAVNYDYKSPLIQGSGCVRQFKCRYPGVYKMCLTVSDGCSTASDSVTITCRCQTRTVASTPADQVSFYNCQGNNVYGYNPLTLTGVTKTDSRNIAIDTVQTCPAPAPALGCSAFQHCCQKPAGCCAPPCPTCPTCPMCPLCPGQTATGGGPIPNPAPSVPAAVPGPVSTPSATPAACTMAEVTAVGSNPNPTAAVAGMMASNPSCGQCLAGCAAAADQNACALACAQPGVSVPGAVPGIVVPGAPNVAPVPGAVPAAPVPGAVPLAPAAPVPGSVPAVDAPGRTTPGAALPANAPAAVPGGSPAVSTPGVAPTDGAAFSSGSEDEEVETTLLLGIIIPMSAILVISALGNFVLLSKLRAAAPAGAGPAGDVAISSSPTSVVVGRSV